MAKKPAAPKKSELDMRLLAQQYGLTYDFVVSVPELKNLFQEAVRDGWDESKWTARLKNTGWWRNTSDSWRKYVDLRASDPATFNAKWSQFAFQANQLAIEAGLGDLAKGNYSYNEQNSVLFNATRVLFADGWTSDMVKSWFGGQVQFRAGITPSGESGRVYNELFTLAYANGRSYQDNWYSDWIKNIASGRSTMEQAEAQIRQQAAADYKAFSQQILAGQNVLDVAAPYMKTVSDLLELPTGSLSLSDPLMRRALTNTSKDGGAYSLWQLENDVRNDERWKRTKNAQDSLMQLGHNVLSTFGVAF